MDTDATAGQSCALPATKKAKVETAPDIPLDISAIPAVQALAQKNNSDARPRKRLRQTEFLSHAFSALGVEAVKDKEKIADLMNFLEELVTSRKIVPRNNALSRVLYAWLEADMLPEGLALVRKLMACRTRAPESLKSAFDEKVGSVALRLVSGAAGRPDSEETDSTADRELIDNIFALLPADALKRRVFAPALVYARRRQDLRLSLHLLDMAVARGIELWDADYHEIFQTIAVGSSGDVGRAEARSALEKVLSIMALHQPIVGTSNAVLIRQLAGGHMGCAVSDSGVCSNCGCTLSTFDLSSEERAVLVDDIEKRLVRPRVDGVSRYEPERVVTDAEKSARWKEFEEFKRHLTGTDYDAVIDGANVGYYGLSNWYADAKEQEILHLAGVSAHRSVDNSSTHPLAAELAERMSKISCVPPFPVDVAPKFALIDSMRKSLEAQGLRVLIVLHARHLANVTPENGEFLSLWQQKTCVLESPSFLNDDYCWLFAAIARPGAFVASNDQMRDHHFLMLSPRYFVRWRQRHRITYNAFYSAVTRSATLSVHMPRCYSTWVQRAATRAVGVAAAQHWHVPYISSIAVVDQATNRTTATDADVDLSKDGDDKCSAWVCTFER